MEERSCEAPGCSMPGTVCSACEQCLCSQHLLYSSCDVCHNILSQRSLAHQLSRLITIGLGILLCGVLFFLLPRDTANGFILQLAVLFLCAGSLLLWVGLIART